MVTQIATGTHRVTSLRKQLQRRQPALVLQGRTCRLQRPLPAMQLHEWLQQVPLRRWGQARLPQRLGRRCSCPQETLAIEPAPDGFAWWSLRCRSVALRPQQVLFPQHEAAKVSAVDLEHQPSVAALVMSAGATVVAVVVLAIRCARVDCRGRSASLWHCWLLPEQ